MPVIIPAIRSRVVLNRELNIFNLARFPAGATGTVVYTDLYAPEWEPIFEVEFDLKFAELDPWENRIQVFDLRGGEVNADAFDPI